MKLNLWSPTQTQSANLQMARTGSLTMYPQHVQMNRPSSHPSWQRQHSKELVLTSAHQIEHFFPSWRNISFFSSLSGTSLMYQQLILSWWSSTSIWTKLGNIGVCVCVCVISTLTFMEEVHCLDKSWIFIMRWENLHFPQPNNVSQGIKIWSSLGVRALHFYRNVDCVQSVFLSFDLVGGCLNNRKKPE